MKKTIISSVLAVLLAGVMSGQGIYVRAGGGYGFPIATSKIGEKYLQTVVYDGTNTVNTFTAKSVKGSYGAGTNFNFALGYKFNENFIFEISTQYLMSNKYKSYDSYIYKNTDPLNLSSNVDTYDNTTSAKALLLNPSFIFSAGFGKAAPYGRFGVVLGSPKVSGSDLSYYDGDGIDSVARKWEYSKGIAFGFQGAIGMNWKITEKLDFYTEVNYVSMTYYAGEYNLTQNIRSSGFGATDNLPGMYLIDKQTIYKKQFDPNAVNNDFSKARVALPEATPFSAVSVQIGIRFQLWKKSE